MSYGRCPRRYCGCSLEERYDKTIGRITLVCPACVRNKAGLCRDCPNEVSSYAMRCDTCGGRRKKKKHTAYQTWRYNNIPSDRARRLKREKERTKNPVVRARKIATGKAWRDRNPRTELDRAFDRANAALHPRTRGSRDRENARRRERYATEPDYRQQVIDRGRARRADPECRRIEQIKDRARCAAARLAAPFVEAQFTGFVNRDAEIVLERALAADSQRETA